MRDYGTCVISIDDVVETLANGRDWDKENGYDFASDLTGLSVDRLWELVDAMEDKRHDPARVLVHEAETELAVEALDGAGVPYDFDSGERFMIEWCDLEDARRALDENGIDYDEV